ncbi:response regulator [Terasakiella sp. SH-1]|uniref:response regulator transcription factor n=1 Tax=Terasakiella sp. SH-1 TaxID=2560057 RepID=UPI0010731862|nr:response regulator [Terasakiella sp. SH-1]
MAHLLIVDDDRTLLRAMVEGLKRAGFDVQGEASGQGALAQLESHSFDLLITDLLMPEIDGLKVIEQAVSANQNIRILAISGGGPDRDGGDLLDTALGCGADAILQKPFKPDEFIQTVQALLR